MATEPLDIDAALDGALQLACAQWHTAIDAYIEQYEMYGDDSGSYCPTDDERALILDAFHGLLSDEDFLEIDQRVRAIRNARFNRTGE